VTEHLWVLLGAEFISAYFGFVLYLGKYLDIYGRYGPMCVDVYGFNIDRYLVLKISLLMTGSLLLMNNLTIAQLMIRLYRYRSLIHMFDLTSSLLSKLQNFFFLRYLHI